MELAENQHSGLLGDIGLCLGMHEMMNVRALWPLWPTGSLTILVFPNGDVPNEPRCEKTYGVLRPCSRREDKASQR